MLFTQLPYSVLIVHVLDFLPLQSAGCIIAVAKFADITAEHVVSYASVIKAELLLHLDALLQDGLATPCLGYRHRPLLLFDPWLLVAERKYPTHVRGRAAVIKSLLEQRLWQTASAALGFRNRVFNELERFMHEDMAFLCDQEMLFSCIPNLGFMFSYLFNPNPNLRWV